MPTSSDPALGHYVAEPRIVLFGCRPLVPFQPGWHDGPARDNHFHAPAWVRAGDRNWPANGDCPACRGTVGQRSHALDPAVPADPEAVALVAARIKALDNLTHCAVCGASSPRNEAAALAQRLGVRGRERERAAETQLRRTLAPLKRTQRRLTERERRQLWNGYKGGILAPVTELTDRAKYGRDFLHAIGQEPDWTLVPDRSGRFVRPPEPVAPSVLAHMAAVAGAPA